MSDPTDTFSAKFDELSELQEDWDTYGGKRIDPSILTAARDLTAELVGAGHPQPHVVPTTTGGVQLEWHQDGADLELKFTSSDSVEGSWEKGEDTGDRSFDFSVANGPAGVKSLVRRLFLKQ